MKVTPFETTERGRDRKTQVLDHIIKLKKESIKRAESIKQIKSKKNEDNFVNYLLEKRAKEKQMKQMLRLKRESEISGPQGSKVSTK